MNDLRWSVSVRADGDRELTLDEIVELADAVATMEGVASGIGTHSYAAQIVVTAVDRGDALERGRAAFREAARTAGLPDWPVAHAEAIGEHEEIAAADLENYQ